jgi:hypothetical protein
VSDAYRQAIMPVGRRSTYPPRCVYFLAIAALASLFVVRPAGAACPGDCNEGGTVSVNELVLAVTIALGQSPSTMCPAVDQNQDGQVKIGELIMAVNAALSGCPGAPTATPLDTHTAVPSPTPTATVNLPPVLPTAFIYRTYPDFPIQVPVGVTDPEGQPLHCTVENLPPGATFDDTSGAFSWTPTEQQLGAFYVPYTCADDATQSVAGTLTFRVSARDACAILTCDPATGCTSTLPPPSEPCCGNGPAQRVPEPVAECPAGRVLHIGQNADIDTFGRLQNCDVVRVTNFAQSGAEVAFDAETRCMNTLNRLRMRATMKSNAANHMTVFDTESIPFLFAEQDDGFARHRAYRFSVNGPGPFFDVEGAEANLTLTLTDSDGTSVTEQIRVRLTFTPKPDLPDVDPSPPPTATPTAAPTATSS